MSWLSHRHKLTGISTLEKQYLNKDLAREVSSYYADRSLLTHKLSTNKNFNLTFNCDSSIIMYKVDEYEDKINFLNLITGQLLPIKFDNWIGCQIVFHPTLPNVIIYFDGELVFFDILEGIILKKINIHNNNSMNFSSDYPNIYLVGHSLYCGSFELKQKFNPYAKTLPKKISHIWGLKSNKNLPIKIDTRNNNKTTFLYIEYKIDNLNITALSYNYLYNIRELTDSYYYSIIKDIGYHQYITAIYLLDRKNLAWLDSVEFLADYPNQIIVSNLQHFFYYSIECFLYDFSTAQQLYLIQDNNQYHFLEKNDILETHMFPPIETAMFDPSGIFLALIHKHNNNVNVYDTIRKEFVYEHTFPTITFMDIGINVKYALQITFSPITTFNNHDTIFLGIINGTELTIIDLY